jgi:hypothetical protein
MSISSKVNDYTIYFPSSINYTHTSTFVSKSGLVTWKDCELFLTTGTNTGDVACIAGYLPCYLNQEEAVSVTLNAAFSAPQDGLVQILGMGDSECGVFVGYNGINFGMCLKRNGSRQYYALQLTANCTANGTITLTLLGNSYSFNVAQGMTPLQTMYMIMQSQALADANFHVFAGSDRLTIYTHESSDFSAVSASDGIDFSSTGIAGTLAIAIPGVSPSVEWVYSTEFQEVSADLATQLNLTSYNVYRFTVSRWNNAPIILSMLDPRCNTFGPLCYLMTGAQGFNTSRPYNPHVSISNMAQTQSVSELRTSMATITSGTPSSNTNITYFSTQFTAENVSVPSAANYIVGVFNVPIILNSKRNYQTCSISEICVTITADRDVVVKVMAGAGLSSPVTTTQHLPWSCMRHGMPSNPTYSVQGLEVCTINVSAKSGTECMQPAQVWLAPGTTAFLALSSSSGTPDPMTVSCHALISWTES